MAFKMKGSPMQRNFGIGSPINKIKHGEGQEWEHEHVEKVAHPNTPEAHNIPLKQTDIGSPVKNYNEMSEYSSKSVKFGEDEKDPVFKQTDKDLKDYLLDEKGFNQADADRMIQDGAYTVSDKGFLAWYKGKDEPAEPKEDVMEEGRTPVNYTKKKTSKLIGTTKPIAEPTKEKFKGRI